MHIPATAADVSAALDTSYLNCFSDFATRARGIYLRLEPAVAPDSHPQGPAVPLPSQAALNEIRNDILPLYGREAALSSAVNNTEKRWTR